MSISGEIACDALSLCFYAIPDAKPVAAFAGIAWCSEV